MGLANYAIMPQGARWSVLHDGNMEGDYETKEGAFEAAIGAATRAIREGHEVHVSVPSREAGSGTANGAR